MTWLNLATPRFVRVVTVSVAVGVFLALTVQVADAHRVATYFPVTWDDHDTRTLTVTPARSMDDMAARYGDEVFSRVGEAYQTWENADGNASGLDFRWRSGSRVNDFVTDPDVSLFTCHNQVGGVRPRSVHYRSIDGEGNFAAYNVLCEDLQGNVLTSHITIDRDEDWYTGTDTEACSFELLELVCFTPLLDLRGFVAHEVGHFAGFDGPFHNGHFSENHTVCTDEPVHTMCPRGSVGTTEWRSLEIHETHTYQSAYP